MAHVVIQIDIVVVDPYRVGQVKGHQRQLAREDRRQVHAAGDMGFDGFEPRPLICRRWIEERQQNSRQLLSDNNYSASRE